MVKLLWFDGDGLCLFQKRLERGRFLWPQATSGMVSLSRAQLSMQQRLGIILAHTAEHYFLGLVASSKYPVYPLISHYPGRAYYACDISSEGSSRIMAGRLRLVKEQGIEDRVFSAYLIDAKPNGAGAGVHDVLPLGEVPYDLHGREAIE
jgi:hypothetical protein